MRNDLIVVKAGNNTKYPEGFRYLSPTTTPANLAMLFRWGGGMVMDRVSIPLVAYFLDQDFSIVDRAEMIPEPDNYTPKVIYTGSSPYAYVLEVQQYVDIEGDIPSPEVLRDALTEHTASSSDLYLRDVALYKNTPLWAGRYNAYGAITESFDGSTTTLPQGKDIFVLTGSGDILGRNRKPLPRVVRTAIASQITFPAIHKSSSVKIASDEHPLIQSAKEEFGTTYNINEAGYITPSGEFLDFSGKREGGPAGTRSYDHRDIGRVMDIGGTEAMIQFMAETGCIRISLTGDAEYFFVDMVKEPTREQWRALTQGVVRATYLNLEVTTPDMKIALSLESESPRTEWASIVERVIQHFRGKTASIKSAELYSVLDIVQDSLDSKVWDLKKNTLLPKVASAIVDGFQSATKTLGMKSAKRWVRGYFVIGSITGRRWNSRSDIDVSVVIDTEKLFRSVKSKDITDEEIALKALTHAVANSINGTPAPGTKHPINYYIKTALADIQADAVYDIAKKKWIKVADPALDIDLEEKEPDAFEDAEKLAENLDIYLGDLRRDLMDAEALEEALTTLKSPGTKQKVVEKLQEKLSDVEKTLTELIDTYDSVHEARQAAFSRNPDEIREQYLSPNYTPENIKYKLLEKWRYLKLLALLKNTYAGLEVKKAFTLHFSKIFERALLENCEFKEVKDLQDGTYFIDPTRSPYRLLRIDSSTGKSSNARNAEVVYTAESLKELIEVAYKHMLDGEQDKDMMWEPYALTDMVWAVVSPLPDQEDMYFEKLSTRFPAESYDLTPMDREDVYKLLDTGEKVEVLVRDKTVALSPYWYKYQLWKDSKGDIRGRQYYDSGTEVLSMQDMHDALEHMTTLNNSVQYPEKFLNRLHPIFYVFDLKDIREPEDMYFEAEIHDKWLRDYASNYEEIPLQSLSGYIGEDIYMAHNRRVSKIHVDYAYRVGDSGGAWWLYVHRYETPEDIYGIEETYKVYEREPDYRFFDPEVDVFQPDTEDMYFEKLSSEEEPPYPRIDLTDMEDVESLGDYTSVLLHAKEGPWRAGALVKRQRQGQLEIQVYYKRAKNSYGGALNFSSWEQALKEHDRESDLLIGPQAYPDSIMNYFSAIYNISYVFTPDPEDMYFEKLSSESIPYMEMTKENFTEPGEYDLLTYREDIEYYFKYHAVVTQGAPEEARRAFSPRDRAQYLADQEDKLLWVTIQLYEDETPEKHIFYTDWKDAVDKLTKLQERQVEYMTVQRFLRIHPKIYLIGSDVSEEDMYFEKLSAKRDWQLEPIGNATPGEYVVLRENPREYYVLYVKEVDNRCVRCDYVSDHITTLSTAIVTAKQLTLGKISPQHDGYLAMAKYVEVYRLQGDIEVFEPEPEDMYFEKLSQVENTSLRDIEWLRAQGYPDATEETWHHHENGGGWVSQDANVWGSAYVGPDAIVGPYSNILGDTQVYENARIEGAQEISGNAQIYGNAKVRDYAIIAGSAKVRGNAIVQGHGHVRDFAVVEGNARVESNAYIANHAIVDGNALIQGKCTVGGYSHISQGWYRDYEELIEEDLPEPDTEDMYFEAQSPFPGEDAPGSTQRIWAVRHAMPAAVIIYGELKRRTESIKWSGSGVLINNEGMILTCAHVVNPDDKPPMPADVRLDASFDGHNFGHADVLWINYDLDVAVIKLQDNYRDFVPRNKYLALGDSNKMDVGFPIIAVGAPQGIDHIATAGIVASDPRDVPNVQTQIFFIDLTILPGSSGGMIISYSGDVVGIARGSISSEAGGLGLNYCVAIDSVKTWLREKGVKYYESESGWGARFLENGDGVGR